MEEARHGTKREKPGSLGDSLLALAGCALGPKALECTHSKYNEAIKTTRQEELLLNLVRLRYNDLAVRLDVSSVAAQFEVNGEVQMQPFLAAAAPPLGVFTRLLPFASLMAADRPTITLNPHNDSETLRRMFSPVELTTLLQFTREAWPVETVFRLWFDYVNGVPNAVTASGPTREEAPDFEHFRRGMDLLQALADHKAAALVFEDKLEEAGGQVPAEQVTASAVAEAAKSGLEYRKSGHGTTWALLRRTHQPRLRIDPAVQGSPELLEFCEIFHLKPGLPAYDLVAAAGDCGAESGAALAVVVRSPVQVLFFLSHGVAVPPKHLECGVVQATHGPDGSDFDWGKVTDRLFTVHSAKGWRAARGAQTAVEYRDYWFYLDDCDAVSKSTFLLMTYLDRLYINAKPPEPRNNLSLLIGR